jgi:hypothetical protein
VTPKRGTKLQTLEGLYLRTVEEGDCRIWLGALSGQYPYCRHGGEMMPVRKAIVLITGMHMIPRARYFVAKCGNNRCIEASHIVQRTIEQHLSLAGKRSHKSAMSAVRREKILAKARARSKINFDIAREIRAGAEPATVMGARYGVGPSTACAIRRGDSWQEPLGIFSGLLK